MCVRRRRQKRQPAAEEAGLCTATAPQPRHECTPRLQHKHHQTALYPTVQRVPKITAKIGAKMPPERPAHASHAFWHAQRVSGPSHAPKQATDLVLVSDNEFVEAVRAQSRPNRLCNGLAGVDVGDELPLPLGRVRAVAQQDDLGAHATHHVRVHHHRERGVSHTAKDGRRAGRRQATKKVTEGSFYPNGK